MAHLSFLICTFNGAGTIEAALRSCIEQDIDRNIDGAPACEIIVVDNASTDGTPSLAREVLQQGGVEWRVLTETSPGKVAAMLRGVETAKGRFLAIIDDDNVIPPTYARRMLDFFAREPELGMASGENVLDGSEAPSWFPLVRSRLACSRPEPLTPDIRVVDSCRITAGFAALPGAGCCMRRDVVLTAVRNGFCFVNDAVEGSAIDVRGEDTELCYLYRALGWRFGIDANIRVLHRIDPSRLKWSSLLRLCEASGAGSVGIDLFLAQDADTLNTVRGAWWWLAARRVRRLLGRVPQALRSRLQRRIYDRVWLDIRADYGGLRRLLHERSALTDKARRRAKGAWRDLARAPVAPAGGASP